jgi:hypothetical protein
VRTEPELKSQRAAVAGQITNHQMPESDMGDLSVSLRSGKLVVAETRSNKFGEFQMECEQQARLQLCVGLRDSRFIQVPLKILTGDRAPKVSRAGASLLDVNTKTDDSSAVADLAHAVPIGQELGAGELDLCQAVLAATKK